jgi:GNAT superfamily N-acetyltransferase
MEAERLRWAPIDFERDFDVCATFRRDSYLVSFGHDRDFEQMGQANGKSVVRGDEGYRLWLRNLWEKWPDSCAHLWCGDEIVGEVEAELREEGTHVACLFVRLYYLKPEVRGSGLGQDLQNYTLRLAKSAGASCIRARVSKTNARALAYYQKHGWCVMRENPTDPRMWEIERGLF